MKTNDGKVSMNPLSAQVVGSSKDGKTLKVEVDTIVQVKRYGKRLHRVTSLLVHNPKQMVVAAGSVVKILPSRRISKLKSWTVVSVG
jgi:ribosomal protein S17